MAVPPPPPPVVPSDAPGQEGAYGTMGGAPAAYPRPCMRRCFWQLGDGFCRNCGKHKFRKNRCCVRCGVGSEQFFVPESFAQAQQYLS
eukprot:12863410-Alexandrium_andersonii.AAC.1